MEPTVAKLAYRSSQNPKRKEVLQALPATEKKRSPSDMLGAVFSASRQAGGKLRKPSNPKRILGGETC